MSILFHKLYLRCLTPFLSILKVQQGFRNYSQLVLKLNMNEAILLHEEGNKRFEMLLRYVNPENNIDKQFIFHRLVDEPINRFLYRIDTNINNYLTKKFNRKKKKHNKHDTPIQNLVNNVENENIKFIKNESILNGDLTCKSILENSSDIKLVIFDTVYELKQNVPYITKMVLSSSILVDFPTYPSKFEGVNVDKTKSIFSWYKNENSSWVHAGDGFLYVPNQSDLGHKLKLKCVPRNDTECGPMIEVMSNDIVQNGPGPCPYENRHAFTKDKLSGKSFRVTSYNILASIYSETPLAKESLYPYCPHYALSMDYRKLLIMKELMGYNSDIMCLQEVDNKIYENNLVPLLHLLNYNSIYNCKNDMAEGLAIFYNPERFDKLTSDYSIISQCTVLDEFNATLSQIQNENVKQTFRNRNTIIQTLTLRCKENPEILVIGNTHLYFKPTAKHIRLLQAYYSLLYLRKIAKETKEEYPECNVSILYCGDFNTVPNSATYQLITQSYVPENHEDWKSCPEESVENVSIKHDINLASSCGTPKYTNYTATFRGCLDYIFYQTDYLQVERVIPMLSDEELDAYTALPSIVIPSDHIALCVDLKWTK